MSTSSESILLPKLGNSVESCILVTWHKRVGDAVAIGEPLCEVETDKTTMQVASTVAGVISDLLFAPGDEVPVMQPIARVGEAVTDNGEGKTTRPETVGQEPLRHGAAVSPRARKFADAHGVDVTVLAGSGPNGRVIVRDVEMVVAGRKTQDTTGKKQEPSSKMQDASSKSGEAIPSPHLKAQSSQLMAQGSTVKKVKLAGARRVIAERMLASLQGTAQLTLHASADARMLQARRARLKATPVEYGLQGININDLVMFAASRVLARRPDVNALLIGDEIHQHEAVHLGFAVDTPRGLLVPVIANVHALTLSQLSRQAKALAEAAIAGKISPDALQGGTFTVSNLGTFGIEAFTPVLNAPQVAILGVGNITLKPMQVDDAVQFVPHIGLSLTVDHRALDGAPAARFLAEVADAIANVDVL